MVVVKNDDEVHGFLSERIQAAMGFFDIFIFPMVFFEGSKGGEVSKTLPTDLRFAYP